MESAEGTDPHGFRSCSSDASGCSSSPGNANTSEGGNNSIPVGRSIHVEIFAVFALTLTLASPAAALEFESDQLKVNDRTGKAVLTGNVVARDDTGTLQSRRLIIRYAETGDTVLSYEAFGKVRIDYTDMNARSEYAYRDARADTLLLQEKAYVLRNGNEFWADRITIDLRTSEITMNGSVRGNLRSRKEEKP